jgi:hypothetical protein
MQQLVGADVEVRVADRLARDEDARLGSSGR